MQEEGKARLKYLDPQLDMDANSRETLLHLQLWEMEEKEADRRNLTRYSCPCKICMGGRRLSRETIRRHLRQNKRDPLFTQSILIERRPYVHAATQVGLQSFLRHRVADGGHQEEGILEAERTDVLQVPSTSFHGQWTAGAIPKLTPFTFWNRRWEIKVSNFSFMGWGLFSLEAAKCGEELLPFVGELFSKTEILERKQREPRFMRYVLEAERNVYVDGDVNRGNVAGFINSSKGRSHLQNVQWEFAPLPRPWNTSEWGYTMTVATKDISAGEELYTYYPQGPGGPIMDEEERNAQVRTTPLQHVPQNEGVQEGEVDVVQMITECFARYDAISNGAEDDLVREAEENAEADPISNAENNNPIEEDMSDLLNDALQPLYEGSNTNRLVSSLLLLNCLAVSRVSNACADELFKLLKELLPTSNTLPNSHYEAQKYLKKMGLSYNSIHACKNGCCLFRKDLAEAENCPHCKESRYFPNSRTRPVKVLRHFPLIPRLKRMFQCSRLASLNKWHASREKEGDNVECVPDSKAWKHVSNLFPDFANEVRNVRMGLALDGVNPFSNASLNHSTWPVVFMNYNLPPWLVTKRFFLMLCLLIPGKESVSAENVDVYLAPMIEELLELWEGVDSVDASSPSANRHFKLRAMLLWCVHDFPAYGLASGQVTKGYRGCTECGPHVSTRRSRALGKNVYLGHRRFLARGHPYRRQKRVFDGNEEERLPPRLLSGRDIMRFARRRENWIASSQNCRAEPGTDPVHETGVKRLSALYSLPYWKLLMVRHVLDPMHCEKNLCENIMKTIWGFKDTLKVRLDLKEANIRPHLHPVPGRREGTMLLPKAPYVLTKEEKEVFVSIVRKLKTPTDYVGQLAKRVTVDGELKGLKSHDYHVLMQQVLPLCIRTLLPKDVRVAIMRVCRVFTRLCAKSVDPSKTRTLLAETVETMCMLEKVFPPAFFDVMTHLPVHLVQQLDICGPVHTRWMYPVERYLKTLKGYVRQRAQPEGSMATGYLRDEALGFCTEYMQECAITERRIWDDKEDPTMNDEIMEGRGRRRVLPNELREWIHDFVLANAAPLQSYRERHNLEMADRRNARAIFRSASRGRQREVSQEMQEIPFKTWLRIAVAEDIQADGNVNDDVQAFLNLPSREAISFRSMWAYGNHIRVRAVESDLYTCDSGVAATFSQSCRASAVDRNLVTANLEYIGWVEEIISVDYGCFQVVVLYCNWVQAVKTGPRATMKQDEYGFTLVKFERVIPYSVDSFAFPLHVQQVFFADDVSNPEWKIVLRKHPRGVRVGSSVDRAELECLHVGADSAHSGLRAEAGNDDCVSTRPCLLDCTVLSVAEVHTALQATEDGIDNRSEN